MKFGAPFLTFLVIGSYGLKEFAELRYTFRKSRLITVEEAEKAGVRLRPKDFKASIEEEAEKLQEENLDQWENIRGPRPWEDSKKMQDEQRQ